MPSNFINERSTEMILVPNIINALAAYHFKVTPIFTGLPEMEQIYRESVLLKHK